ncbi:FAD-binding and (Fe-S)-binding domain-containing protein [Tessaracoccus lubricantis]|uniref:D-lactate dehydrogenase (cytochrome) n=1 Tax=Tessaracoccus lubricantis TaxID=545543 RepID=A0ABP9FGH3_9ACTN
MTNAHDHPKRDERAITRLAMAHDASHFLLTPTAVVTPTSVEDVSDLMAEASFLRQPITFRSGGTSLCGQAVTDGVLVDVRRHFRGIEVLDGGERVRAGAGATLAAVNARLAPYGRRLGPDPTSAVACTIGGIIANNSSGMLAGNEQTAYHTVESMVFVLPSGRIVDTADPGADITLRLEETKLVGGLHMLRNRLRTNPTAIADINRLFSIKNTMGYGINALLEFHRPVDIIPHLLVGSEGTLGFVAEATFRTVPRQSHSAAALAVFPDLDAAATAAQGLVAHGFEAIELMDVAALRVVRDQPTAPPIIRDADLTTQAVLLVELHDTSAETLAERVARAEAALSELNAVDVVELTTDPEERNALIELRRGLYALVAGARASGTTTLLEDLSLPLERFADMCKALDRLFDKHGYGIDNVPLFAHARDGNIHFLLSERFDQPAGLLRYRKFTRELVREVLRRGGVLKAEHGTGRAMAPFVQAQYGDELYEVMREIKHLFDPAGVMNPGVIISDDPDEHLRNLKLMPTIEPEVDNCIECGYCESVCPSRDLTVTPRQRIVLRRELAARQSDHALLDQITDDYLYAAIETCAVDGMCSVACPLGINTGDLVRRQRTELAQGVEKTAWTSAARHWGLATRMGSAALTMAKSSTPLAVAVSNAGRRRLGDEAVPGYDEDLPRGAGLKRRPLRRRDRGRIYGVAAYFPSCVQTVLAPAGQGTFHAFRDVSNRADVSVSLIDATDLCCGAPWKAKGLTEGYDIMTAKTLRGIDVHGPDGARLPIVMDASSCTLALREMAEGRGIEILDLVQFAAEHLLPHLAVTHPFESIAVHPTCASTRMDINDHLLTIARAISKDVVVPDSWACCGWAGDRGVLHPELTESATREMAEELAGRQFAAYASTNRTCELAMSRATGQTYRHIIELLAEATRPG